MIDKSEFVLHDFRKRYKDSKRYTLSMSLECAEHIPVSNAEEFISTLTDLSDIVLFSGAVPFQRGRGHINEQYPSYWIQKFDERGYQVLDVIRGKVWNNKAVRGFYAQNIFLYVKKGSESYENLKDLARFNNPLMYDVIHPEVWEQVNRFKLVKIMDKLHDNKLVAAIYYTFLKRK